MADELPDANRRLLNHLRDRIESLEAERDDLAKRVAELERVVDPDGTAEDYASMSREQKVFQLRSALLRKALANGGSASMEYAAVQAVFGNRPSAGHAYTLMELAADADGYGYNDDTGTKRLTIHAEDVNDDALVRHANNAPRATPA